jgi:cytosine/adenosine deaminase-related metal-dependent hydrolase
VRVGVDTDEYPVGQSVDLGDYCILPGFVNSHTHLEFSDRESPVAASGSFPEWLAAVVRSRPATSPTSSEAQAAASIERGLEESSRLGVQYVLDVVHPLPSAQGLGPAAAEQPFHLPFAEIISTKVGRARQTWRAALDLYRRLRASEAERDPPFGLSPHAPYTTTGYVVRKAAERCQLAGWPIMMHLAESREELSWIENGGGSMQEFLEGVVGEAGLPTRDRRSLAQYIEDLCRAPFAFIIHGNYLNQEAIDMLAKYRSKAAVVYCPRTHQFFGHPPHPLLALRRHGIQVTLGTDSRASNPDLSILEEARLVRRLFPELTADAILEMITSVPQAALSRWLPDRPRWTVVPCEESRPNRVLEAILEDHRPATTLDRLLRSIDGIRSDSFGHS